MKCMPALTAAVLAAALSNGCAAEQRWSDPAPASQPATLISSPLSAITSDVQGVFDRYVAEKKVPGIVGALGVGELSTAFPAAGAIADDPGAPPAGPDSLWRIYSMTKPITGMAAMMLVEDGKLRLDQPISDFFPGFANMRVLTQPDSSLDSVPARKQDGPSAA